jgi:hypothetical protein
MRRARAPARKAYSQFEKKGKLRREALRNALPDPDKQSLSPPRLEIYRHNITGWFMRR